MKTPRKLRSILAGLEPVALDDGCITARVVGPVGNLVETNRRSLDELLSSLVGRAVHLQLESAGAGAISTADSSSGSPAGDPAGSPAGGPATSSDEDRDAPAVATPEVVANDPLVARVVELFGARSIRVAPKRPADTSNP